MIGKTLFHIWGPFSIQSYGFFIVMGIVISTWLLLKNPRRHTIISTEQFNHTLIVSIVSGIIGGRILYLLEEPPLNFIDSLKIWEGGLSSLGSILGILIVLPIYLKYIKVPIFKFFDLLAIYTPLMQSIARLGCFFAGCCHGMSTTVPWAVIYKDTNSIAPLHKAIHPTQLYSSIALLITFLLMFFIFSNILKKPGQLISTYLIIGSIERFSIDFLRGDRSFLAKQGILSLFSVHQWISILIIILGFLALLTIQKFSKKYKYL